MHVHSQSQILLFGGRTRRNSGLLTVMTVGVPPQNPTIETIQGLKRPCDSVADILQDPCAGANVEGKKGGRGKKGKGGDDDDNGGKGGKKSGDDDDDDSGKKGGDDDDVSRPCFCHDLIFVLSHLNQIRLLAYLFQKYRMMMVKGKARGTSPRLECT